MDNTIDKMHDKLRLDNISLYNTAARLNVLDNKRYIRKNARARIHKRTEKQINLKSINTHKRLEENIKKYRIK